MSKYGGIVGVNLTAGRTVQLASTSRIGDTPMQPSANQSEKTLGLASNGQRATSMPRFEVVLRGVRWMRKARFDNEQMAMRAST